MEIFGSTFKVLEKALDLQMTNNKVIAGNIANADTPGFQALKLDFNASMQRAVEAIESADAAPIDPADGSVLRSALGENPETEAVILPSGAAPTSLDGNNVAMEEELGDLSRNGTMYQLTSRLLAAKYNQIRSVLDQGSR